MNLQDDVTEVILAIGSENPGSHFRAIGEESNKQIGVVDYHINKLLKELSIISFKHRGHKLFFLQSWENKITE